MSPKISDLGLTTEQVGQAIDYATIPDQFGTFTPPPDPGPYRFRLPARLDDLWEVFDHPKGNPPGKRIRAHFDSAHPLTIIQSVGDVRNGEPFETSVTNAERQRGRKGDPSNPWVSDMDYVFRDVWGLPGKPAGGNPGQAAAFQQHAGTEFSAEITWSWFCNPKNNIYADNGQGGLMEVPNQKGCDTSYYQKDVDKVHTDPNDANSPLVWPLRVTCTCGANLRAFANLQNFKP